MPSGRLCADCEREVTVELVRFPDNALQRVADMGSVDPTPETYEVAHARATLRLSCSCSHFDVEVSGGVGAFDFVPRSWSTEAWEERDRERDAENEDDQEADA